MMHALRKMAAVRYFPSIHDNTTENRDIWAPCDAAEPKRLTSPRAASMAGPPREDWTQGDAWSTPGRVLASPDYRPLDAFGGAAEDPGPASWSQEDEICELLIRLKEIELRSMMEETCGAQHHGNLRNIWYCRMKQTTRKQK